jgi:hypothetical protein
VEKTFEKTLWLANLRHWDLSELIAYVIAHLEVSEAPKDNLLKLFADDPESVDKMLEEVMKE